ncbi:MAG: hypothetical protein AAFO87_17700, partial [Cyanobacteria bacterium J06607_6]
EAAAYAIPYEAGSHQIEAAVILKPNATLSEADLKQQAAERLPAYAIPQRIAIASSFPRTGTGKIDRRALRAVAMARNGGMGESGSGGVGE